MKRTVLIVVLAAITLALTAVWILSHWFTLRASRGSLVGLPCTEILCSRGVVRVGRLSRTSPVSGPTDSGLRDYRLMWWRSISGPVATVRDGGVKITGGRGIYTGFRLFSPSPSVAIQNVQFTRIDLTLWPLIPLAAVYPIIALIRVPYRRHAHRRKEGLCVNCGYDLTGNVSGVCPECGEKTVPQQSA